MQTHPCTVREFRGFDLFSLMAAALAPVPLETPYAGDDVRARTERRRDPGPGLIERIDQWLWRMHQRDVEAYLAGSADIYELEARQRALACNVPIRYH